MSQARDFADSFSAVSTGRRNLIINGAFEVAQRSTSEVTGAGYTTVDRWRFPAAGQKTQQVTNDRDLSIPKMLKATSSSTGYGIINQRIEDVTKTSGQTVTASFWAKTSDFNDFRFYIYQKFGTSGSSDVTVIDDADYFTVSGSGWTQYTATVTIPSVSGKTIGTGSSLDFGFGPNSGTDSGVVYYSEVQLELGNSASPFEHRSYGEELALCSRYCQKIKSNRVNTLHHGRGWDGDEFQFLIPTLGEMRSDNMSHSGDGSFTVYGDIGINSYASDGDDKHATTPITSWVNVGSHVVGQIKASSNLVTGGNTVWWSMDHDAYFLIESEL